MEEFDRHIKSKIDSLHEVPGVKFDEERVWKRIRSTRERGLFFGLGFLIILVSFITIFLPKNENQRKITEYHKVKEIMPEVLIDSTIAQVSGEIPFENTNANAEDSIRGVKRKSREESKSRVSKSTPIRKVKKPIKNQNTYSTYLDDSQANETKKEISMSFGKESQTIAVTHLKELNNQLSLSYGIQFNKSQNRKFGVSDTFFKPYDIHKIQFPIGVRYNFFRRETRFNMFFYGGIKNSFLLGSGLTTTNYNLKLESELGLDYRIFSTKDGKKGYLRFKLPLYSKDIVNQGTYQPSFYDVLKK